MANSRGITTLILTLGITAMIFTGCERETERTTTVTEASPSPAVGLTPSPTGAASPYGSPTGSPVALTPTEKDFISRASRGSMEEVQLGRLAAEKGSSPEVKQFGERMVTDHGQLGQRLQQMASNLNVTPEQQLSPEQQNTLSRLEKLSGKAFDREYIRTMVADHVKDISEFERIATQATNANIKQFASESLPMLRDHLNSAREIAAKLGAKSQ
jgi:putative membrane protein